MSETSDITAADATIDDLAKNLGRPSLEGLAYVLRHPETWPEDFAWDYDNCRKCAMGLAQRLWFSTDQSMRSFDPSETRSRWASWASRQFAVPYETASEIFFDARAPRTWRNMFPSVDDVTPEHVAQAIDKYLATAA